MNNHWRDIFGGSLLAVASATVSMSVWGQAVESGGGATSAATLEELREQVRVLQMKVEEMGAKQVSRADVDAIIREVLADSAERSKLFGKGGELTAGYDRGFFIRSEDGANVFRPGVLFQFRGVANYAEDAGASNDRDELDSGFEVRRLRVRFDGSVYSPALTYSVQFDVNRSNGAEALLEAWGRYRFSDDWAVKAGQYKLSFSRERDMSSTSQQAVDRTLVDQMIGGAQTNRVQGVSTVYGGGKDRAVRVEYSVDDGPNSSNTDFRDTAASSFGTGARAEWKLAGDWGNYRDFSARGTQETLAVLGGGAYYADTTSGGVLFSTVDVQVELAGGWGFFAAGHGRSRFERGGAGQDDAFDAGAIVQGSYMFTKSLEGYVRYDYLSLDDGGGVGAASDSYQEVAVGGTYFFGKDGAFGHRAKISADVVYLPDGGPSGASGLGIVNSEESQVVFRTQLTLQI
jgi:hypothetical protein